MPRTSSIFSRCRRPASAATGSEPSLSTSIDPLCLPLRSVPFVAVCTQRGPVDARRSDPGKPQELPVLRFLTVVEVACGAGDPPCEHGQRPRTDPRPNPTDIDVARVAHPQCPADGLIGVFLPLLAAVLRPVADQTDTVYGLLKKVGVPRPPILGVNPRGVTTPAALRVGLVVGIDEPESNSADGHERRRDCDPSLHGSSSGLAPAGAEPAPPPATYPSVTLLSTEAADAGKARAAPQGAANRGPATRIGC